MSWDVHVMKFPEGFDGDFDNLPEDWEPEDICTHECLKNKMKKLFPNIDNEDTTWMTLDDKSYSIEFNVGEDDPIKSITLHVRGGDESLKAIKVFCEMLNCQALDTTKVELIDFGKETNEGFSEWREYRDKVIKK